MDSSIDGEINKTNSKSPYGTFSQPISEFKKSFLSFSEGIQDLQNYEESSEKRIKYNSESSLSGTNSSADEFSSQSSNYNSQLSDTIIESLNKIGQMENEISNRKKYKNITDYFKQKKKQNCRTFVNSNILDIRGRHHHLSAGTDIQQTGIAFGIDGSLLSNAEFSKTEINMNVIHNTSKSQQPTQTINRHFESVKCINSNTAAGQRHLSSFKNSNTNSGKFKNDAFISPDTAPNRSECSKNRKDLLKTTNLSECIDSSIIGNRISPNFNLKECSLINNSDNSESSANIAHPTKQMAIYLQNERFAESIFFKDVNMLGENSAPILNEADASSESSDTSLYSDSNSDADRKLKEGIARILKDKTLLCNKAVRVDKVENERNKSLILSKIERVLAEIEARKEITVRNRCWSNCVFLNDRLILKPIGNAKNVTIRHSYSQSEKKFDIIVMLLKKIKYFLLENCLSTKRELFYQNVHWVNNQNNINDAINCISCILNVGPWEFGVFATSKGLVYGNMKITLSEDDKVINCNIPGGTLIPQDVSTIVKIEAKAYFILVVEKDSMFQKLLDEDTPNKLTRPFILITGKGYPDTNTRLFLHKLWATMSIPAFILVDADPHGIEIMLTYRFGSLTQSHLSDHLTVPNLQWIGIFPSEILTLGITRMNLNDKEVMRVNDILTRPYIESYPKIKEEFETLVQVNVKAEIEGLMKCEDYMSNVYLPNKFYNGDFI